MEQQAFCQTKEANITHFIKINVSWLPLIERNKKCALIKAVNLYLILSVQKFSRVICMSKKKPPVKKKKEEEEEEEEEWDWEEEEEIEEEEEEEEW